MPTLLHVLIDARRFGFLGPGPVEEHLAHTEGFVLAAGATPASFVDLGSGGGVPGLALAVQWPETAVTLIESRARRGAFLEEAIEALGLTGRVTVLVVRAEDAARDPALQGAFPLVTARSFAPPPVTAECARPFLAEAGVLLVSEPTEAPAERWPADGLADLGFADDGVVAGPASHVRRLRAVGPCPESLPRRAGMPSKRPRW